MILHLATDNLVQQSMEHGVKQGYLEYKRSGDRYLSKLSLKLSLAANAEVYAERGGMRFSMSPQLYASVKRERRSSNSRQHYRLSACFLYNSNVDHLCYDNNRIIQKYEKLKLERMVNPTNNN